MAPGLISWTVQCERPHVATVYVSTFEDNVEYREDPDVYSQRDLDSLQNLLAMS